MTDIVQWRPVPGWKNYFLSEDYQLKCRDQIKTLYLNKGYMKFNQETSFFGRSVWTMQLFHRVVGRFVFNPLPAILKILDHIDGDKCNNAFSNLRWITQQLNLINKPNAKGVKVLTNWYKPTLYVARYKQQKLGCFKTYDEAHNCYNRFREKEYAKIYKQILDDNDVSDAMRKHPDVLRASVLTLP